MKLFCVVSKYGLTKGKLYKIKETNNFLGIVLVEDDFGNTFFFRKTNFVTKEEWYESLKHMLDRKIIKE